VLVTVGLGSRAFFLNAFRKNAFNLTLSEQQQKCKIEITGIVISISVDSVRYVKSRPLAAAKDTPLVTYYYENLL